MPPQDAEPWLDDLAFVRSDRWIDSESRDQQRYEVFTGSKPLAAVWLSIVGVLGGAFGGLAVSGALWGSPIRLLAWLAAIVLVCAVLRPATIRLIGTGISFLAGWCLFWGFLIAACGLGAAQAGSPYWAYGIAGGVGFLIGITHGAYEPPDMQRRDGWFALGMLLAPAGAVAAAWGYRNLTGEPSTVAGVAACGAAAALIFIVPLMAMLAANWRNEGGLRRLASLYLHGNRYAGRAITLIDRALRIDPGDPTLFTLRGFAHLLLGNAESAEADWRRHLEMQPNSVGPLVARGAYLLRRDAVDEAVAVLEDAVKAAPKHARAIATLGLAHHRRGNLDRAIALYERATGLAPEPLTLTRLAEAHCDAGQYRQALDHSEVAISELDSPHGRSWLVRARAHLALGHLKEAEEDFRVAFEAGEEDVAEEAQAALEEMGADLE